MKTDKYKINWEDNSFYLRPLIEYVLNDVNKTDEATYENDFILPLAFICPHEQWVYAGFSGSSKPDFILLDYSNENVAFADKEDIDLLYSKKSEYEQNLPSFVHCGISMDGEVTSLCGINSEQLERRLSDVTCPHCMKEVFSRKNSKSLKAQGDPLKSNRPINQKIALSNNLKSHWKNTIENESSVLIFSPYLTDLLLEVCDGNESNIKAIYTKFSLNDFVTGASSIGVIRSLINLGIDLYYCNDLHAKVVLAEESVTIGSQNCTNGSEKNFELSVIIEDKKTIEQVYWNTIKFRKKSKIITQEMMDTMDDAVSTIDFKYQEFIDDMRKIEHDLLESPAFQYQELVINTYSLQSNIDDLTRSESVLCTFREINDEMYNTKYPIMPNDVTKSLLNWTFKEQEVDLVRLNRYLIVDQISGRLGWARIAKTRISFVDGEVYFKGTIQIFGQQFMLLLESRKLSYIKKNNQNIAIVLSALDDSVKIKIGGYFDLGSISNISLIQVTPKRSYDDIFEQLESHLDDLIADVLEKITTSFDYSIYGVGPQQFFDEIPHYFNMKLALYNNNPFFLLEYTKL